MKRLQDGWSYWRSYFFLYILALVASIILFAGAFAGTIYGGQRAIRNYAASFKENMIDSNRMNA